MEEQSVRIIQTIDPDIYDEQENRRLQYIGRKSGKEVFDELVSHLDQVGLLPEEYFLGSLRLLQEDEIPDYRTALCCVDWGGNEGIYLDVFLLEHNGKERNLIPFATGKTLDASGDSFLHMQRIAAECSMMLNGRGYLVRVSERNYEHQAEQDLESKIETAQTAATTQTASSPDLQDRASR